MMGFFDKLIHQGEHILIRHIASEIFCNTLYFPNRNVQYDYKMYAHYYKKNF